MSNRIDLTAAQEVVGPIVWNELRLIRRLCWHHAVEAGGHDEIELVLRSEKEVGAYELTLSFNGIRGLKIDDLEDPRMTGFDLLAISDRQWESINWEIGDFEDNKLRFFCHSVSVESARRL